MTALPVSLSVCMLSISPPPERRLFKKNIFKCSSVTLGSMFSTITPALPCVFCATSGCCAVSVGDWDVNRWIFSWAPSNNTGDFEERSRTRSATEICMNAYKPIPKNIQNRYTQTVLSKCQFVFYSIISCILLLSYSCILLIYFQGLRLCKSIQNSEYHFVLVASADQCNLCLCSFWLHLNHARVERMHTKEQLLKLYFY